ncbi:magnesium/cobalt transporter CorA [Proteiniclasticum sp. SCR006]|uniref:Magnesium transport protein CorA n=1 Tax=Proteiniclasticum aestuarii TaxID=2817862 RepID=A0A939HCV1_9CLOT|nr:magnesium/cobalt transporter CorA [Proteiniclasticum aestuarii]MBO1265990.1 magnesium/cobalt transporter CorA [Proteiniclasticum aestuarii]
MKAAIGKRNASQVSGRGTPEREEMISVTLYNEEIMQEKIVTLKELMEQKAFLEAREGFNLWINIDEGYDNKVVEAICALFDIHPLVKEDIILMGQRPKVEEYEHYIFSIVKMIYYKKGIMKAEQLSFILGKNYVITFGEEEGDVFDPVRVRLRKESSMVRKEGVDFLFYSLMDALVEEYFHILSYIGERIDVIEYEVLESSTNEELKEIRLLKKDLLYLHKFVWPLREVTAWLGKEEVTQISDATSFYFKDLNRELVQIVESTETYREVLSSLIEITLSSISYRLNEVMKVLTIISTIFIPLTFIAGVYGMNFRHMPELYYRWGYPIAWIVMLLIAAAMIYYFKKKKWF